MGTSSASGKRARAHKVAADNPEADESQVDKTLRLMDVLRELGMTGPSYTLDSPYERRHRTLPAHADGEDHPSELSRHSR